MDAANLLKKDFLSPNFELKHFLSKSYLEDSLISKNDKFYTISLTMVNGIGVSTINRLLDAFGTSQNIFNQPIKSLCKVKGINIKMANKILNENNFLIADKLISHCKNSNIKLLLYWDDAYPAKLKQIYNPPAIIYYKGNFSKVNNSKIISIVGTRGATNYGKNFVTNFIQKLQDKDFVIISGLAIGIDKYVHESALENNISTIGVLPCSIDEIYPLAHTNLAIKMQKQGGLLSEYSPFLAKENYFFPARNRIIAGLSDVTIVVEAGKKSGALITAEFANDYNREVFAVPGDLQRLKSEGCNQLIASHKARIFTSFEEMNDFMNWKSSKTISEVNLKEKFLSLNLDSQEKITVDKLQEIGSMGISLNEFLLRNKNLEKTIFSLEMKNLIDRLPGGKIALRSA